MTYPKCEDGKHDFAQNWNLVCWKCKEVFNIEDVEDQARANERAKTIDEVKRELEKCNGYESWIGEVIAEFKAERHTTRMGRIGHTESPLGGSVRNPTEMPRKTKYCVCGFPQSKAPYHEHSIERKIFNEGKIAGLEMAADTTNFMISQSCQCDGNYVCVLHRLRECLQEEIQKLRGDLK